MTDTVPLPSETRYVKRGRRYYPVEEKLHDFYRFPQGRWVLTVLPGTSCCLTALPNMDEALYAALQKFRFILTDAIHEASKSEMQGGRLTKDEVVKVVSIIGDKMFSLTTESAGGIAYKAVEEFGKRIGEEGKQ
jgi:hypothetical protein